MRPLTGANWFDFAGYAALGWDQAKKIAAHDGDRERLEVVRNAGFWASGGVPKMGLSALMEDIQTAHSGQAKPGPDTSNLIIEVKSSTDSAQTPQKRDFLDSLARKADLVRRSRAFGDYLSEIDPHRAEKLRECGGWLIFRDYVDLDTRRLAGGLFCQQRLLCPFCASRIAARRSTEIYAATKQLLIEHRQLAPYMVTLTMRGMDDRGEMVKAFWKAWTKLGNRRRRAIHGRGTSVMGIMEGGFLSGEAKLGKGGRPHYHAHGIFLAPKVMRYKPVWERLKREWAAALGQGDYASVQFQPVKGPIEGGVREATKYAVKFEDTDFGDRVAWFGALHRVRTFRKFGLFHNLKLSEQVTDDLTDLEHEAFVERLFSFRGNRYDEVEPPQKDPDLESWNTEAHVG